MNKKYAKALDCFPPFAEAVRTFLPTAGTEHARLTLQVTAPVLFTYVWYVLREAERMGLKRLYFLARDGYVLLEIAKEIVKVCPVGLELRYLYCSRASLRMPSYHRIPEAEAMDLLLHRGTNLTVQHILDRADVSDTQRKAVYEALGMNAETASAKLSENDFNAICDKLRNCNIFRSIVMENSRAAYETAMPYFIQEGLTDGTRFGIVDSGWTGSMQRSLRQLSDEIPPMTGFYFGMFARRKSSGDGIYNTWYFSADSSISVRTKFNNNLFECMCAAPHGMTIGYRQDTDRRYVPVMKPYDDTAATDAVIRTQISSCQAFAACCAARISYQDFDPARMHDISRQLLTALMYRPDKNEAEAFSCFTFCDDVTESYSDSLVRHSEAAVIKEHLFLRRMAKKLRGQKPSRELFWVYGSLAVSGLHFLPLRRFSLRFWDVIRCILDGRKN
ncbi:MAG: hypothetical protein IJN57_09770 [Oscillospiraceae bacterium]|nr:hypothetical protein [Oscillospiraceae bacterium]